MKEKIIIYTNETCPYCKNIKETLKNKNIKFEENLILKYKKEWEVAQRITGMSMLPTLFYKDTYFVPGRDFANPEHLLSLLENYEVIECGFDRLAFEHIRTMNYNISQAFNQIQTLLKNTEENEHKSTS